MQLLRQSLQTLQPPNLVAKVPVALLLRHQQAGPGLLQGLRPQGRLDIAFAHRFEVFLQIYVDENWSFRAGCFEIESKKYYKHLTKRVESQMDRHLDF